MSLQNEIIDYLKNFPEGVKVASIRGAIKRPAPQITSTLWKMKKLGKVSHSKDTHVYKLLTDVNKTKQAEPKVNDRRLQDALAQAAIWREEAQSKNMLAEKLNARYEDALAVIRYLEDKLFKAIQINARNGNS
jgi:hypothetical protein